MTLPRLDELLEYKNPAVLKLYEQNYPKNTLTSEEAFQEMLKYLWLAKKHELELPENKENEHFPEQCFMARSMQEIDEMWHEFILFTRQYMDFCAHYFGEYRHHLPNIFDNAPRIRPRAEVEIDIEKLLLYIHQHLGEDTVRTWFSSYLDENAEKNK